MRAALVWVMVMIAPGAWTAADPRPVPACAAPSGKHDPDTFTKPSSFVPHPRAPNNAYGMPIQPRILTKHRRPPPKLKSSPLPPA